MSLYFSSCVKCLLARAVTSFMRGLAWKCRIFISWPWLICVCLNLQSGLQRLSDFPRPFWLALFVEGTRFTEAKLKAAQEYAASSELPIPRNVLIPRTKVSCNIFLFALSWGNLISSLWPLKSKMITMIDPKSECMGSLYTFHQIDLVVVIVFYALITRLGLYFVSGFCVSC